MIWKIWHIVSLRRNVFGFEEVAYLLLSGHLPDKEELASFCELINDNTPLEQKTKMNIIELEGNNIMNILARSVLEMYRFDPQADDTSRDNLMRQSIDLISKFPTIIAYAYNMLRHATYGRSLHIRHPREKLSIAENFLYMLKRIIRNWMRVRLICCWYFRLNTEVVITLLLPSV